MVKGMTENEVISAQIWRASYVYYGDQPEDDYTGAISPYEAPQRSNRRTAVEAFFDY